MYSKAREKVQEILAAPMVDPLPGEVVEKLDGILRKADAALQGD
jgi:hypothetical protein